MLLNLSQLAPLCLLLLSFPKSENLSWRDSQGASSPPPELSARNFLSLWNKGDRKPKKPSPFNAAPNSCTENFVCVGVFFRLNQSDFGRACSDKAQGQHLGHAASVHLLVSLWKQAQGPQTTLPPAWSRSRALLSSGNPRSPQEL